VFQQWGKMVKNVSVDSGVSAMGKEQRVADNGVSAMGKLASS
jgi:hypothetical protein